ncbi:permease-like cell division protein FtsX [Clostridium sp.]|uniref:permease-like cell division protein FtsX n=1 Tax=Clostridium sp. TaxID=1506 RepID=UPI001B4404F7|nr:permease-like cell division protein FtsX [Clostridium sp.]MBP3914462.1 permease-like cell division protein FtsX [Clostridium sp.]
MIISNLIDFIIASFKNIKRNKILSITTIATITFTFFILGIFIAIGLNLNENVDNIASKVEIQVYLKNDIDVADRDRMEKSISKLDGVEEVTYENKNTSFTKLKKSLRNNEMLLEGYDYNNNPLLNSFIIKVNDLNKTESIINEINKYKIVDSVNNQKDFIDGLINTSNYIKIFGSIAFILLSLVSIFLITNTIKLTVHSRKKEIAVMKLVGATNWFVKSPFIIEGITLGVLGASLNIVLLILVYNGLFSFAQDMFQGIYLINPEIIKKIYIGFFIVAGAFIGIVGSTLSIKKYLKV